MNEEKNKVIGGTLYLVSTPLGNMADLSYRAAKVLSEADFIAAEDTRVARKLLTAADIGSRPCVAYHEHNKKEAGDKISARLLGGESCALITDAGTPAISDPGADIVKICIDAGISVTAVPGCCAAIDALVLSGIDTRRFVFEGFLDSGKKAKLERLEELSGEKRTVIFYEAPHRLTETLGLMRQALGNRKIAICRELTKLNEEIMRMTLDEAISEYSEREPKGEYVIVTEGNSGTESVFWEAMSIEEHVMYYVNTLNMDKMSAVKAVAKDRGVAKNQIYKQMI